MSKQSKIRFEGKHITVYETETGWEYVSRKPFTSYREGNKKTDAVIIVPIIRDKNGKHKLVMTNEWREPLNSYVYGFPAGLIDGGEDVRTTVKRELKEETGLDCVEILHQTPQLFSSEGLTDECVSIVYVEAIGTLSKDYLESNEDIMTYIVDREFVFHLLNGGEEHSYGKAAYFIFQDFVNTNFNWLMEWE